MGKGKGGYKVGKRTEHEFKKDMLAALSIPGVSYFRKVRGSGMQIGLPDIMGVIAGKAVMLELKVHPEYPTPRQQEELKRFTAAGAYSAAVTLAQRNDHKENGLPLNHPDNYVVVVVPTIPIPNAEPLAQNVRISDIQGECLWLDENCEHRAYELPFARRKGGRIINVMRLINAAVGYELLVPKSKGDDDAENEHDA